MAGDRTGLGPARAGSLLWQAALDLCLGGACAGCGRPGATLCVRCRAELTGRVPVVTRPDPAPPGYPFTLTLGDYDTVARRVIAAHKERQAWSLTTPLGRGLATVIGPVLLRPDLIGRPVVLVPLPSDPAAVRRRGLDSVRALTAAAARELAADTGLRLPVARLLRQRRRLVDQAGLDRDERRANLRGALECRPAGVSAEHRVVLVDDVTTTGATLAEAARAVREAGVGVAGAAVLAATRRRLEKPANSD